METRPFFHDSHLQHKIFALTTNKTFPIDLNFFLLLLKQIFEEKMFRNKKFNHGDTLKQSLAITTNHGFVAIAWKFVSVSPKLRRFPIVSKFSSFSIISLISPSLIDDMTLFRKSCDKYGHSFPQVMQVVNHLYVVLMYWHPQCKTSYAYRNSSYLKNPRQFAHITNSTFVLLVLSFWNDGATSFNNFLFEIYQ